VIEPIEKGDQQPQQALEPIEQDTIEFHGEQIIAARLVDGRIAVVLRWVCESLRVDPQAQVRRIQRTGATASELVRIRVQTAGGRQAMPAITLRGFSPWVLGINPNEVKHDDPQEAERIRALIIAYQEEAKDVLYQHFVNKQRPALLEPQTIEAPGVSTVIAEQPEGYSVILVPAQEPGPEASHSEKAAYHDLMSSWHRYQAARHAQAWRAEIEDRIQEHEAQLEGDKELVKLIPEILERIGPEKISTQQQTNIRGLVKRLSELSGTAYQTVYWELAQAFQAPRYEELLESQYPQVEAWFKKRIDAAAKKRR
jgi:hypothetical protein